MADTVTPEKRSEIMSRVRGKNTRPEMAVRRLVHRMGYRYRLHRSDLPGKPDMVFTLRRKVIFVHGCFWHGHDCPLGRIPKSRVEFWVGKITGNKARDERNLDRLRALGWACLVIWECQLKNQETLEQRIREFLE